MTAAAGREAGDAIRIIHEMVLPAALQQPGFHGLELLVDRSTGQGLIVSRWTSEEKLAATEDSRYLQEHHVALVGHFTGPPEFHHYTVVLSQ